MIVQELSPIGGDLRSLSALVFIVFTLLTYNLPELKLGFPNQSAN